MTAFGTPMHMHACKQQVSHPVIVLLLNEDVDRWQRQSRHSKHNTQLLGGEGENALFHSQEQATCQHWHPVIILQTKPGLLLGKQMILISSNMHGTKPLCSLQVDCLRGLRVR
jgi:hypothetical protein